MIKKIVSSKILLVGKPNSGKSLLFNRLTGLDQKVANFPGVTVTLKKADWESKELIDFPGSYSLNPLTADEKVAVEAFTQYLSEDELKLIVCVLDSTQLYRSFVFAQQILVEAKKFQKKVVLVFNFYDEVIANKLSLNLSGFQEALGVPCLAVSAKSGYGLEELKNQMRSLDQVTSTIELPSEMQTLDLVKKFGPQVDVFIKKINRWDSFFLSSLFGGAIFLAIMFFFFQALFTWSVPLMDFTENTVLRIGESISSFFSPGLVRDFISGALFGGLGTFLVFVPQIFILTFILGIFEDSGYLARIAIICHKPLKFFGLSGKSFIPYLSGHACAIPAIYATRMIDSPKKRFITLITIPLISCSARLPVFSLLITTVIPEQSFFFGLVHMRGLIFFALFLLGYVLALLVSGLSAKFLYKNEKDLPFVIELPSYRRPYFKPLFLRSVKSAWEFLSSAGPVIFVTTLVVWVLGYFPNGDGNLESSWLYDIAHWTEPVFAPMGLDWKFGIAILTSFIAREVFVGTLGTFYGIEGAEDNIGGLSAKLNQAHLSLASGVSLLIFYVIALQCVSTLAVIKKETNSVKVPVFVFIGYTMLAYVFSLVTYSVLK